jgi:hypothetical protein
MTAHSRAASSRHITGISWHRKKILHDAGTRASGGALSPRAAFVLQKTLGTSRENALGVPSKKTDA